MPDYPLPHDTVRAFGQAGRHCRNPGLLFDRYTGYSRGWKLDSDRDSNPKHEALEIVRDTRMDDALHRNYIARWQALLAALSAETFEAEPEWRFIVGLGGKGPLEVGMTFHRIYGFPLIPGSSLKGLARAYAELVAGADEGEILHVFGHAPGSDEDASAANVGRATFFDAVPLQPPRLEIDVMNPHYAGYYQGNDPPADYLPPTPIYFLTVGRDSRYLFAVAGPEKTQALAWLRGGLSELGSGAKTGAGYGYFTPLEATTDVEPPTPAEAATKPTQPEPELPLTWRLGTVRQYRPDKGSGKLVDDATGEELSFKRTAIEEQGWSPGRKHRIRYAVVERDGYPVVVEIRRR